VGNFDFLRKRFPRAGRDGCNSRWATSCAGRSPRKPLHISDIDPTLLARQIRIKPPLRNDVREIILAGKSEQTAALGDPGL